VSRSKRATLEEAADPFALAAQAPDTSMPAVADALYGTVDKMDEHRKTARPVDIFDIQRHPMQPRRAIPHAVMKAWGEFNVHDMGRMFDIWLEAIKLERGGDELNVENYLNERVLPADFEADADHTDGDNIESKRPLEATFLNLIQLAVSIRKDGLTNPVTVVFLPPDRYQLETGERRWLAYHLLYHYTRDERFSKISAREVDHVDVWRQAAENNARANLNAISRARQLAVLLMDVLHQEKQISFTPFDDFSDESGFYAQVADGEKEFRIPRNQADKLLNAVGLRSKKQLREYRALLRLPKRVWQIADDLNWRERFIRDLVADARDDEDALIDAAEKFARKSGYSVPMGTVSQKKGAENASGEPMTRVIEPPVVGTPQYVARYQKLVHKARQGNAEARTIAIERIQEMRFWLDEQERQLKQMLKKS
jgi:ParB-like chromosome segregation protein Spo0J